MTATATSGAKRRSRSEGESDRSSPEEAFSPAPSTRSSTKHQIRHRASIACASCRERRIRCVVGDGESECAQCRRTGAMCIIKDDDERRRPISKAYMSSLSSRIALLEEMLQERGVAPPPAVHPPKTRHEAQARQHEQQQPYASERSESCEPQLMNPAGNQPPTPPGSGDEDLVMYELERPKDVAPNTTMTPLIHPLLLQGIEPKKDVNTRELLCSRGNHTFDQAAGRTRFFGPTANSHVYARSLSSPGRPEHSGQVHRAERVIGALRSSTHDHLMTRFWDYYNSSLQVVDEVGFEAGLTTQDPAFYSPFLHLTMLAIGYRFADLDRDDVKMISLENRDSTLHREAKSILEVELETPGGIPSVQALLLLADLECGIGRDTTGWMYSGMANRLAFDIGLHVNSTSADITELEQQTRRRAMAACVMFDRKWALLLGRPTTIKLRDIGVDVLRGFSETPLSDSSMGTMNHAAIHRQMFELMELAGKVADFQNSTFGTPHAFSIKGAEDRAYLHFIGLERLFRNWYRRLPGHLAWTSTNTSSAPMSFFILHQQFHVCMILLHRPWAKYGPTPLDGMNSRYPSPESVAPGNNGTGHFQSWMGPLPHHDNRASMSRSVCTQHAIRVAQIFWHHRQRFDGKKIGISAIQHAGTAAVALMAALAHKSAELDHHSNLRYLQVISAAIYDMSHLYQPAARMYHLLKTMLVDIRSEMVKSGGFALSTVSRFQDNTSSNMVFGSNHWATGFDSNCLPPTDQLTTILEEEEDRTVKRRRLSSHSSVDLACLSPMVLSNSLPTEGSSHNPITVDQESSEPSTFDLDFFHASFVDFINSGGSGPATQDWASPSTNPLPEIPENPTTITTPIISEALSSPTAAIDSATPKPNDPSPSPPPAPAPVVVDDDATIEDWLAEPAKPSVPAPAGSDSNSQPQHQTATPQPQPPSLTTLSPTTAALPQPSYTPQASMNPDGTPIHRDPYVVGLETELGLTCGVGMGMSQMEMGLNMGMGMDWGIKAEQSPCSSSSLTPGAATAHMTPVTLDELVLSVEEAVGSARARARERQRERAVSVGSGSGSGSVIGIGGVVGVGVGEEGGRRRSELDFLKL